MHIDADLIVEGALDESRTFKGTWTAEAEMDAWAAAAIAEMKAAKLDAEVYILIHDHDDPTEDDEDACAQYLTDHRPYLSTEE